MSDEQRLREFFYDPKKAEEMVARACDPEREDTCLKNRATVAKLSWQPRSHDPHLPKWLHRIDVPTLVIWGDHDKSFPKEHAQAYHKPFRVRARDGSEMRPCPADRKAG
jgi:pimeloyl-ACP methyl ester carboxylesterase